MPSPVSRRWTPGAALQAAPPRRRPADELPLHEHLRRPEGGEVHRAIHSASCSGVPRLVQAVLREQVETMQPRVVLVLWGACRSRRQGGCDPDSVVADAPSTPRTRLRPPPWARDTARCGSPHIDAEAARSRRRCIAASLGRGGALSRRSGTPWRMNLLRILRHLLRRREASRSPIRLRGPVAVIGSPSVLGRRTGASNRHPCEPSGR